MAPLAPWFEPAVLHPVLFCFSAIGDCRWPAAVRLSSSIMQSQPAVEAAKISQALRRFKNEGFAINPLDKTHIAAYLLARETSLRPRAETVLQIIAAQQLEHSSGASFKSVFYIVPAANFPNGIPGDIAKWQVSEQDLRANYDVSEYTDLGAALIFDDGCPKSSLGLRVRTVSFFETIRRQSTTAANGSPPPTVPAAVVSEAAQGALVPAPAASASVPANAPEQEPPPSKKSRVLKMMLSETDIPPEEKDACNWEALLGKVKQAAKAGHIFSADPTASGTVFFWSSQVLAALKVSDGEPTPTPDAIKLILCSIKLAWVDSQ